MDEAYMIMFFAFGPIVGALIGWAVWKVLSTSFEIFMEIWEDLNG